MATRDALVKRLDKIEAAVIPEPQHDILIRLFKPPMELTGVFQLVDGRLQEVSV